MGIKHKRVATRPQTPDADAIQSQDWNDVHEVDGVLGSLLPLAPQPDAVPYIKSDLSGGLTALSALGRVLIAMMAESDVVTRLGALNKSGDAMAGPLAMGGNKVTGLGTPTAPGDAVTKAYADALITALSGALVFKGAWDASAGTFPSATGRKVGWFYKVSVAGTVNGKSFSVGDDLFAIVDDASASTYADNWLKIEGTLTLAEIEAAVGFTFGTAAALNAGTSVGNLVQVSTGGKLPALDGSLLTNIAASAAWSAITGKPAFGGAALLNVGTASGTVAAGDDARFSAGGESVGAISLHAGNAAPSGKIKANGALLSRVTYAPLWTYAQSSGNLAASDAAWTSGSLFGQFSPGDGSTTFRIPYVNGYFFRAWDDSRGVDIGRGIGTSQADDLKAHTHTQNALADWSFLDVGSAVQVALSGTANTGSTGGGETRPKNIAFLACIKY